jgi:hypothetical protein
MEKSPESFQRFDSLVRSERYFTATLLPAVLFHNDWTGFQCFTKLVDATVEATTKTECNKLGERGSKGTPQYDFQDVEVITEFHIARDLQFAHLPLAANVEPSEEDEPERRDAPDVVIRAGRELVVCEGKFFSEFNVTDLNNQLRSQRRQVRHLFCQRQQIRAYRHVAIVPFVPPPSPPIVIDADAVLTWVNIRDLAERVLGSNHYVTLRLRDAVERFKERGDPYILNYNGILPFHEMRKKCREPGNTIQVGHIGGEADLRRRDLVYAEKKPWKWRYETNKGVVNPRNWLDGALWLKIVESTDGFNGF